MTKACLDKQGTVEHRLSFKSLYAAWRCCRRRKRGTAQAQRYEAHLLDALIETEQALKMAHWKPGRSVCFVTTRPKAREIHAAAFADRVVHHWLVPQLEELYEPVFIYDSYSNRQGKGTHAAVNRVQHFMRSLNNAKAQRGYYLQLDIKNFFNRIDRPLLFGMIQQRLRKSHKQGKITTQQALLLQGLSHTMLENNAAKGAEQRGHPARFLKVPAHKRLANAPLNKGIPIGNLTSQFFANVYLDALDQFVKHQLKCRCYVRYVDDFILLHHDQKQLLLWQQQIQDFLHAKLELELKPMPFNTSGRAQAPTMLLHPGHNLASPTSIACCPGIIKPNHQGVDFLGYIIKPDYRLVRKRVVSHLREKLDRFEQQNVTGSYSCGWQLALSDNVLDKLRSTLSSYLGHFKHASSERLMGRLFKRYAWLNCLFLRTNSQLKPLWAPQDVSGYLSQLAFFKRKFPCASLLSQRGFKIDFVAPAKDQPRATLGVAPDLFAQQIRASVKRLQLVERGYLKGGLKRRTIQTMTIHKGVKLCGES